ncbi:hypothetical protein TCAL_17374 [Tigriopus californicus]|uniref:Uncharacterized protein n=1 Tax=Tigriopus californicus TaxID=6832 RepID=A0A553NP41_TIGCA|nr:hypothetical protein TCAL_17374 [Tigriopus californicus]
MLASLAGQDGEDEALRLIDSSCMAKLVRYSGQFIGYVIRIRNQTESEIEEKVRVQASDRRGSDESGDWSSATAGASINPPVKAKKVKRSNVSLLGPVINLEFYEAVEVSGTRVQVGGLSASRLNFHDTPDFIGRIVYLSRKCGTNSSCPAFLPRSRHSAGHDLRPRKNSFSPTNARMILDRFKYQANFARFESIVEIEEKMHMTNLDLSHVPCLRRKLVEENASCVNGLYQSTVIIMKLEMLKSQEDPYTSKEQQYKDPEKISRIFRFQFSTAGVRQSNDDNPDPFRIGIIAHINSNLPRKILRPDTTFQDPEEANHQDLHYVIYSNDIQLIEAKSIRGSAFCVRKKLL